MVPFLTNGARVQGPWPRPRRGGALPEGRLPEAYPLPRWWHGNSNPASVILCLWCKPLQGVPSLPCASSACAIMQNAWRFCGWKARTDYYDICVVPGHPEQSRRRETCVLLHACHHAVVTLRSVRSQSRRPPPPHPHPTAGSLTNLACRCCAMLVLSAEFKLTEEDFRGKLWAAPRSGLGAHACAT